MSNLEKTLQRVLGGHADANIRFSDIRALLMRIGFAERIRGDHHIFTHDRVPEILNLQPRNGKAKPYQVKQVRTIITFYGLASVLRSAARSKGKRARRNGPTGDAEKQDG